MNIKPEVYNDTYYYLSKDLIEYPDAWCYAVYSRRGIGKTYGALNLFREQDIKFVYIKRTNEDIDFICSKNTLLSVDPSPFYPINRDKGCNVIPKLVKKGFGAFYNADSEDNIIGAPIGYILSLNAVKRIKGYDLSEVDIMLLDEFIPQKGEIVKLSEGEMLLDAYMTISRDRLERGREPLKLILFANAEEISTPITNTLEITDLIAGMKDKTHYYDPERDILIHHITEKEIPITETARKGIFKGMYNTDWFDKSFGGEFSGNDFSNIVNMPLKNMQGMIKLKYKRKDYFIYYHPIKSIYYMTTSPCKCPYSYDLSKENDQKKFYVDFGINLRVALSESRFFFKFYSMYDLINHYKKYFDI